MLFSSVTFLFFFLPFTLTLYTLAGPKGRNAVFFAASLVFYAWGEGWTTAVLLLSIVVNYGIGLAMGHRAPGHSGMDLSRPPGAGEDSGPIRRVRRFFLISGLIFNLGLLTYYKYADFAWSTWSALFSAAAGPPIGPFRHAVPAGISFFTFTAISYLVDCYQGRAEAERNPTTLALYLAAFPRILAGPIVAYHEGFKELKERPIDLGRFASGIERFILGLGKKVLIANPLAGAVDQVFGLPPENLTTELAWFAILLYTLQIYFDFSGYTDMAIGVGRMFGFEFPENFNFPYVSQSIRDFWRRWHMSLSHWLRDYLYIPLGGNRCRPARNYLNLVTVFLLCGLWHGANWTFVVWGLWYGVFLMLERTRVGKFIESAPRPLRHLYALLVVGLGWVFFRSESLSQSMTFFRAMAGWGSPVPSWMSVGTLMDNEVLMALVLGLVCSVPILPTLRTLWPGRPAPHGPAFGSVASVGYGLFLGTVFLLACMALAGGTLKSFIYFRF